MKNLKKDIRAAVLNKRRNLAHDTVLELSKAIQNRIIGSGAFKTSSVIMAYMPIQNEVRTELLLEAAMTFGKTILLPRVIDAVKMEAAPVHNMDVDLQAGSMGIREPDPTIPAVDPQRIDLVILPGIAFDRKGYRIGFGAGYYDRFIPYLRKDCILLAPAYDFQVLDHIPADDFDQPAHMIVTEKETLHFSSNKSSFM